MTKQVKGLLAGCAVLTLLGGGLAVLLLNEPEQQEESSVGEEDTSTPLWHTESDLISRIEVSNPKGDTFAANRKITPTETTDYEGNTVTEDVTDYILEGYEALPMETYEARMLATRAPELSSISTIVENANDEDLKTYGFDQPIKVKYTVDEADPIVFYVGNISTRATYSYLMLENDNRIFMIESSAVEMFRKNIKDFLGTSLTESFDTEKDAQVENIRIRRKDLDYEIYCEYDKYYETDNSSAAGGTALHVMKEPIPCLLSPDKSEKATHGLFGLSATEVVKPFPSEADMAAYGLDDPYVSVTMVDKNNKTTVFIMGNTYETEDGKKLRYGCLDSINCVYGFSADNTIYGSLKAEDITSKVVVDSYVWDIGHLTYEADGRKWEFEGKGSSADDFVMTYNGNSFENLERYRLLYTYLLKTAAEELVLDGREATGTPMASVKIEEQNDKRSYDVAFYDGGGLKAYIAVNGKVLFACRKSFVTTLIENLNKFDDEDKQFTMTW